MKLTRKFLAAMLSVCMVLALLTPASAASEIKAGYGEASYYEIAVSTYSRMLAFQDGVVPAANQAKQYGLIDPTGKVVLPFQYAYVWTLGGGLFGVATKDNGGGNLSGLGIANAKGQVVLAPSNDYSEISFQNNTVCVHTGSGSRYFTTDMKPSTEAAYEGGPGSGPLAQYDWSYQVGDYYMVYKNAGGMNSQEGVLDSKFEVVIPLGRYESVNIAASGSATVFIAASLDKGVCVLDTAGKTVVDFGKYNSIMEHFNGGATLDVELGSQKGVIDFTGKVLVPLGDYSEVGGLNKDGYITAVSADGSSTLLFKDGKQVKSYAGKQVTSEVYYRGLAFTTGGEKYGMMDVDGKVLIQEQFSNILDGENDYLMTAVIGEDDWEYLYGLYTQEGAQVFDTKYSELMHLADSKYKLYDGTYYGVFKATGATTTAVIPMKYVDMRVYTVQFIELYDGSKYSIVDLSNNVVVPESTEPIEVFNGSTGDDPSIYSSIDRLRYYGEEFDGYTKSVLPFCLNTGSGLATVYADFDTGVAEGQVPYRASNITEDGWFVYQNANGWYGFARTGNGFLDVAPGTWATEAVDWAVANGIVQGTAANKFDPTKPCKQQDILLMLHRSKGKPTATVTAPVAADKYAVDAVNWAYEQGMIDDSFVAGAPCTRAQAVQFIWMAEGKPTAAPSTFSDVAADAGYAMAVNWAVEKKITTGVGSGRFGPDEPCQRDTIAAFLFRAQK